MSHELSPGIYTIKDVSDAVYTMGDHAGTLKFEYDDISMKAEPILPQFRGTFRLLRFDEYLFLLLYWGFTPYCD